MLRTKSSKVVLRTMADACFGLILFLAVSAAISGQDHTALTTHQLSEIMSIGSGMLGGHSLSHGENPLIAATVAAVIPAPPSRMPPGFERTTPDQALILFACVFSALVALNLAFFRHLRRVYASPR